MSAGDGSLKIVMPGLADQEIHPAINVIDADSMQLVETALSNEEVSVPAGKYLLSSTLPTGERSLAVAQVSAGELEEVSLVPSEQPPISDPGGGAPSVAPPLESLGPPKAEAPRRSPAVEEWFVRYVCVGPQGIEDTSVHTEVEKIGEDETVELSLRVDGAFGVVFAQVAAVGQIPQNVALPVNGITTSDACRLTVATSGQLTLSVSLPANPLVDAVARYSHTGALGQAAHLATQAEKLLKEKIADPYGAALGGYALLRLHELGRLHDWSTNLANFFPWLADGAIVAGEKAALEGDQVTAATWMADAARRGLPAFADGFSMLASRLREYGTAKAPPPGVSDALVEELTRHAERLVPLATMLDFSRITLAFPAADLGQPARSQTPLASTPTRPWHRFTRASGLEA
jgi:hypothetical protein